MRLGVVTRARFDLCVIGGGPSGLAAALRAVDYHKSTCIVEQSRIGGVDLWDGALQSKVLWEMSKLHRLMSGKTAQRFMRYHGALPEVCPQRIRKALDDASEFRQRQISQQLRSSNIPVIHGTGRLLSAAHAEVQNNGNETSIVEADYFLLATGSVPRPHPLVRIDGTVVVTSDEIMHQPFPKSIVIIGAGVIGCEFASILANFGGTQVFVIEKSNRILPMEDEDVALYVQKLLETKGVVFHHSSVLTSGEVVADRFHYRLRCRVTGNESSHTVDRALVAIGRIPRSSNLGLEELGAAVTNGMVDCDAFHRVKPFRNIYAVGDLTTKLALVNVAELEGRSSVDHMYKPFPEDELMPRMDNLSTIMFLDQEVAAVGLNEQQCQSKNVAYRMARYGYEFVSRAVALGNTRGFVKLIVTNDRKMQVLGVRAIGPHASSIVELASLAIHKRESAHKLGELLTAYPAITQGFQECLRMLLGTSILKPNVFPELVVSEWSPPAFARGRAHQTEELARELTPKRKH